MTKEKTPSIYTRPRADLDKRETVQQPGLGLQLFPADRALTAHVFWEGLDMTVDEVSAERTNILVHLQSLTFWQPRITKAKKADRWPLFGRFDANRDKSLQTTTST